MKDKRIDSYIEKSADMPASGRNHQMEFSTFRLQRGDDVQHGQLQAALCIWVLESLLDEGQIVDGECKK